jgi:hypothetical protein
MHSSVADLAMTARAEDPPCRFFEVYAVVDTVKCG